MQIYITRDKISEFITHLKHQEYAPNSIRSYQKDIFGLIDFLEKRTSESEELKKEYLIEYKQTLTARLKPASVNRNIAAVNKFLHFLGLDDFRLKTLKIQEQTTADNELTKKEFDRLLKTAFEKGKLKVALIMLTLAYTGIRIGELQFITVEAVRIGRVVVNNKGTIRTVVISKDLQQDLLRYCRENHISRGVLFTGSRGAPISRSYVAHAMKEIAKQCGIEPAKVFPHNLRHYFARRFLDCGNPLSDLADILGHKSVDTTRRYLKSTVEAKQRQLSKLKIMLNWQSITDNAVRKIV